MQQADVVLLLIVIAVVLGLAIAWQGMRQRRTNALRARFGSEYDRTLAAFGHRRSKAEANLDERVRRVDSLDIRPLTIAERDAFLAEWQEVKSVFVDSPPEAILHADRMIASMMQACGYPVADFEQRFEDLTVMRGAVAGHYRAGHGIVKRQGQATTEDLRQAMKHYEALFDDLIADGEANSATFPNQ